MHCLLDMVISASIRRGGSSPKDCHGMSLPNLRKRQRIFYPVVAILTIAMLAGVYGYINAEETALKTIPPISTTVESPLQTPQP